MVEKIIALPETLVTELKLYEMEPNKKKSGVLNCVSGPFAEMEIKNRNGRFYSRELIEKKILNSSYVKEMMDNNSLFGEPEHPEKRLDTSLSNVSHIITELWIDDAENKLWGKADILDTPSGRVINTLVNYGAKIGVSARAVGSVTEKKGIKYVNEDDYVFRTFDFVPAPGFESSRVEAITEEEKLNLKNNISLIDKLKEEVSTMDASSLKIVKSILSTANNDLYKDVIVSINEKLTVASKQGDTIISEDYENLKVQLDEAKAKVGELEAEKDILEEEYAELEERRNKGTLELKVFDLLEKNKAVNSIVEDKSRALRNLEQKRLVVEKFAEEKLTKESNKVKILSNSIKLFKVKVSESMEEIQKLNKRINLFKGKVPELREKVLEIENLNKQLKLEEKKVDGLRTILKENRERKENSEKFLTEIHKPEKVSLNRESLSIAKGSMGTKKKKRLSNLVEKVRNR